MSLTATDLDKIRLVVREEARSIIREELAPLDAKLEALERDVKEIFYAGSATKKCGPQ